MGINLAIIKVFSRVFKMIERQTGIKGGYRYYHKYTMWESVSDTSLKLGHGSR